MEDSNKDKNKKAKLTRNNLRLRMDKFIPDNRSHIFMSDNYPAITSEQDKAFEHLMPGAKHDPKDEEDFRHKFESYETIRKKFLPIFVSSERARRNAYWVATAGYLVAGYILGGATIHLGDAVIDTKRNDNMIYDNRGAGFKLADAVKTANEVYAKAGLEYRLESYESFAMIDSAEAKIKQSAAFKDNEQMIQWNIEQSGHTALLGGIVALLTGLVQAGLYFARKGEERYQLKKIKEQVIII